MGGVNSPHNAYLLERGLKVKEYELYANNFSETGNFGFGIEEHIDLGIKYDPTIGIYGMDFYAVMARPGLRVGRRRVKTNTVGAPHRIQKADTQKWFKQKFDGVLLPGGKKKASKGHYKGKR